MSNLPLAPETLFTAQEYLDRHSRVAEAMTAAGCEAVIAFANKVHPGHVRYLTGFETRLGVHDCAFCLFAPGSATPCILFTNSSWDAPPPSPWLNEVVLTSDFAEEIAVRLSPGVKRVGLAGWRAFPAPVYIGLMERLSGRELTDISDPLAMVRMVKSPAEITALRRCAAMAESGGRAFLEGAREGATERGILVAVESALKLDGSEEVSYSTQVSSAERTALTVAFATDRRLQAGDPVQLDCGPVYQGYRADFSRATVVGQSPESVLQLLEVTADMFEAAVEVIRPGVSGADLARAAVAVAEAHGLGDYLYHSPYVARGFVGHGIGCGYHEPPMLNLSCETLLQEGIILILEPILQVNGLGGVKIEDMLLVTADGVEWLSNLTLRPWREDWS